MTIQLSFQLKERDSQAAQPRPIARYKIRALTGELRLQQYGDSIGELRWLDPGNTPLVNPDSGEWQSILGMELDPWRLERLELWRAGKPPVFWLQLWPSIVSVDHGWYDTSIQSFACSVPREAWLSVLDVFQEKRFLVLEVPCLSRHVDGFNAVGVHLSRALTRLDEGQFSDAVVACRLAMELLIGLAKQGRGELSDALSTCTDDRRGAEYAKLVVAFKDVTNLSVHASAGPPQFTRAEAVFVVQMTQHAVALIGNLVSAP
ncbi:MAG TPA: hypothetical protein VGM77_02090 [Gemmatimonadales bacterium]|jgi:hypothetical protein